MNKKNLIIKKALFLPISSLSLIVGLSAFVIVSCAAKNEKTDLEKPKTVENLDNPKKTKNEKKEKNSDALAKKSAMQISSLNTTYAKISIEDKQELKKYSAWTIANLSLEQIEKIFSFKLENKTVANSKYSFKIEAQPKIDNTIIKLIASKAYVNDVIVKNQTIGSILLNDFLIKTKHIYSQAKEKLKDILNKTVVIRAFKSSFFTKTLKELESEIKQAITFPFDPDFSFEIKEVVEERLLNKPYLIVKIEIRSKENEHVFFTMEKKIHGYIPLDYILKIKTKEFLENNLDSLRKNLPSYYISRVNFLKKALNLNFEKLQIRNNNLVIKINAIKANDDLGILEFSLEAYLNQERIFYHRFIIDKFRTTQQYLNKILNKFSQIEELKIIGDNHNIEPTFINVYNFSNIVDLSPLLANNENEYKILFDRLISNRLKGENKIRFKIEYNQKSVLTKDFILKGFAKLKESKINILVDKINALDDFYYNEELETDKPINSEFIKANINVDKIEEIKDDAILKYRIIDNDKTNNVLYFGVLISLDQTNIESRTFKAKSIKKVFDDFIEKIPTIKLKKWNYTQDALYSSTMIREIFRFPLMFGDCRWEAQIINFDQEKEMISLKVILKSRKNSAKIYHEKLINYHYNGQEEFLSKKLLEIKNMIKDVDKTKSAYEFKNADDIRALINIADDYKIIFNQVEFPIEIKNITHLYYGKELRFEIWLGKYKKEISLTHFSFKPNI